MVGLSGDLLARQHLAGNFEVFPNAENLEVLQCLFQVFAIVPFAKLDVVFVQQASVFVLQKVVLAVLSWALRQLLLKFFGAQGKEILILVQKGMFQQAQLQTCRVLLLALGAVKMAQEFQQIGQQVADQLLLIRSLGKDEFKGPFFVEGLWQLFLAQDEIQQLSGIFVLVEVRRVDKCPKCRPVCGRKKGQILDEF